MKTKKDYFPNSHERIIYDMEQIKAELEHKLERLKKNSEKNSEKVVVVVKDKRGEEYECRKYEEIQDLYAWELITYGKFDKYAKELDEKKEYYRHEIMIPQIEDEIYAIEWFIKEINQMKKTR